MSSQPPVFFTPPPSVPADRQYKCVPTCQCRDCTVSLASILAEVRDRLETEPVAHKKWVGGYFWEEESIGSVWVTDCRAPCPILTPSKDSRIGPYTLGDFERVHPCLRKDLSTGRRGEPSAGGCGGGQIQTLDSHRSRRSPLEA